MSNSGPVGYVKLMWAHGDGADSSGRRNAATVEGWESWPWLANDGACQLARGCAAGAGPRLGGSCEREGTAVEDVLAALPDEQCVEGTEGPCLAGQREDVGGGAFSGPVPGWKGDMGGEAAGGLRIMSGQPLVE